MKFSCIVCHAVMNAAGPAAVEAWWAGLRARCRQIPPGHIPLLFVDSNASFFPDSLADTMQCAPANLNAPHFQAFCRDLGVQPSAQRDCKCTQLVSWSSRARHKLIDYVGVPVEWGPGTFTMPAFSLHDLKADIDHKPIQVNVRAWY